MSDPATGVGPGTMIQGHPHTSPDPTSEDGRKTVIRPTGRFTAALLDETQTKVLKRVQVNMPWRYLPDYLETVLEVPINLEIGLEAHQLDSVSPALFRSLAQDLHRAGCRITLHGPFWDLCPGSSDAMIRRVSLLRFHQLFDLVEAFRPIHVVCHTGFDTNHHGSQQDSFHKHSLSVWEPLVARAETLKTPLLLENVWEHGPELHRKLLKALRSPYCGFCLDVGHQHSFSQTPLTAWIDTLGEFLREVHVHDNHGTQDTHLPVGQGTVDFKAFFGCLRTRGLNPLITLEPHCEEHLTASLAGLAKVMAIDD